MLHSLKTVSGECCGGLWIPNKCGGLLWVWSGLKFKLNCFTNREIASRVSPMASNPHVLLIAIICNSCSASGDANEWADLDARTTPHLYFHEYNLRSPWDSWAVKRGFIDTLFNNLLYTTIPLQLGRRHGDKFVDQFLEVSVSNSNRLPRRLDLAKHEQVLVKKC